MKKFLSSFVLAAATVSAKAHESVLPHTHVAGFDHVDLLVWSWTGLAVLAVAAIVVVARQKRRKF